MSRAGFNCPCVCVCVCVCVCNALGLCRHVKNYLGGSCGPTVNWLVGSCGPIVPSLLLYKNVSVVCLVQCTKLLNKVPKKKLAGPRCLYDLLSSYVYSFRLMF